jgi:hypothetical protein
VIEIYKTEIAESRKGNRLVLPANVRELMGNPKAYTVRVVEENGHGRKIVLEPKK